MSPLLRVVFLFFFLAIKYLDDVLQPTVPPPSQRATSANQPSGKILANDLDSSLANLVGSKHEAFHLFLVTKSNKQMIFLLTSKINR